MSFGIKITPSRNTYAGSVLKSHPLPVALAHVDYESFNLCAKYTK